MVQTISRTALQVAMKNNDAITLVEALPKSYFDDGHLPGAIQINAGEVDEKAPALLKDKAAVIVVYCANAACENSGTVAMRLAQLGYTNVFKYVEGKKDWIEAGLPIQKSA